MAVLSCIYIPWVALPVAAAQTVIVQRDSFSQSVSVAQLREIETKGAIPLSLKDYASTLTSWQQGKILAALQAKLDIEATQLQQLLATDLGQRLVHVLAGATTLATPEAKAAVQNAFIGAAESSEGLSVLSFIEAYPRNSLEIDLERVFLVLGNFNAAFWQTQAFMAQIAPQLTSQQTAKFSFTLDPSQPGTEEVQVISEFLDDSVRQRRIPVAIYWSRAASQKKPIIVFSHGLGSVNFDLRYLAQHLASHGYVVAALEHPGSNSDHLDNALWNWLFHNIPPLQAEEFLERPQDVSFLLDQLAILNQSPGLLEGKLATDNVLILGYSLGGSTSLALAGGQFQLENLKQRCRGKFLAFSFGENAQCFARGLPQDRYRLRDPRIKAAIAFSPTASLLFGNSGLSQIEVPTLMTSASADKTTPALTEQVIPFTQIVQPKWLVGFVSGTHLSVKDPSTTTDQVDNPNTIYTGGEIIDQEAVEVRKYIKAITLAMAAQLTDQASRYRPFLTPEYAQFSSTGRFPIRLVREIPPEAQAIIDEVITLD